ncbi:MauE/DoxX family redox-associated membrane protein [Flavobacterium soli]|uniref:MauE/DoxX family redox-associated membrane protein n=1 Tax=Flavobacterium soli TaxID=344881 RepID=UPI000424290F|nr:MauE/DoxX family redox-associated membrane protein [Flavobacterium soli]
MNRLSQIRPYFIDVVVLLYVLLFTYAATSKLIDHENFRVQLGQSPLLSAFAAELALGVPLLELLLAGILLSTRWRFAALLGSLTLMAMFSAYIHIILHHSPFVPCSCGGVLEKMTWHQHLTFNLAFVLQGAAALLIMPSETTKPQWRFKMRLLTVLAALTAGGATVLLLFNWSEDIVHHRNTFIRRFPGHGAEEIHQAELGVNSYYFAGAQGSKIYLGNVTAPLTMTVLDTTLTRVGQFRITLDRTDLPFRRPQIKVSGTDFYVYEGTAPYIYKGSTDDWKGKLLLRLGRYFSQLQPGPDGTLFLRYLEPPQGEHVLGAFATTDTTGVRYNRLLLEKQIDGIFDTDGDLHYSASLNSMAYVYRYRNQYTVADSSLQLRFRGNTIDTISQAQLALTHVDRHGITTHERPPLVVNRRSAVDGPYLYVNSALMGRLEPKELWSIASIIDVYDMGRQRYEASFYLYHINGKRLRSLIVSDGTVYALIDDKIVAYRLMEHLMGKRKSEHQK